MKLALMTWPEVEAYLECSKGIILPVGSTEQHGPMGLIGTDALCASEIAEAAADMAGAIVAPTIAYAPAPFNTGFPGTVSISEQTFLALVADICDGLSAQGFETVYVLNAHGANLAPLRDLSERFHPCGIHIRSWWDFEPVNTLRRSLYGSWEGLHATPSEVAITQARFRVVEPGAAAVPPRQLNPDEIAERAGDRHGSAEDHRREFPDGRVGAHSALARPEDGERLLNLAAMLVAEDYREILGEP
ncbi:creatininase family protein [Ovoidimarina sediminis]|uniref:creatininase family protein n=1 Tax=Ovoidimarina sediminis TaxID=3079856 RepID=UPI002907003E|nr:creatininase family protein [Rhodophyticola sp. MJ-SS7]MDU8946176.1 creatininase family protein [Rhodophyticola sp. MJ-SS7]